VLDGLRHVRRAADVRQHADPAAVVEGDGLVGASELLGGGLAPRLDGGDRRLVRVALDRAGVAVDGHRRALRQLQQLWPDADDDRDPERG
jgi:hypothetical protein